MREWHGAGGRRGFGQHGALHELGDDGVHQLQPPLIEVVVILLHRLCNNQVLPVGLGTLYFINLYSYKSLSVAKMY